MKSVLQRQNIAKIRPFYRVMTSVAGLEKRTSVADHCQQPDFTTPNKLQSFQLKANYDLLRSWIILRFSAIDVFVDHSEKVGCLPCCFYI